MLRKIAAALFVTSLLGVPVLAVEPMDAAGTDPALATPVATPAAVVSHKIHHAKMVRHLRRHLHKHFARAPGSKHLAGVKSGKFAAGKIPLHKIAKINKIKLSRHLKTLHKGRHVHAKFAHGKFAHTIAHLKPAKFHKGRIAHLKPIKVRKGKGVNA